MRCERTLQIVAILVLLLIATPSINSVHSSLQQAFSIQSMGNILIQDGFGNTFFEYGAEYGVLEPPWDTYATGHDDPPFEPSKREVSSDKARTGSKSIYFYQPPPPKTGDQRHPGLRLYQTDSKDFYFSWWSYFDNRWLTEDTNGWGTTMGGWQVFFGPTGEKWRWWCGGRFFVSPTSRVVKFSYGVHVNGYESDWWSLKQYAEIITTEYYITDYLNQWVHFQVYINFTTDNAGTVKAWFNNNLVMDKSGFATDPQGHCAWNHYNCIWAVNEYPFLVIELYQSTDSFESCLWIDDVVAATEKVPESYRVVGQ